MSAPAIPALAPSVREGSARKVARVAVLGASGYSGQEFVRLALAHDGVKIAAVAGMSGSIFTTDQSVTIGMASPQNTSQLANALAALQGVLQSFFLLLQ